METEKSKQLVILAWAEMTGIRHTGRHIKRDGNYSPETEACMQGKACVYSYDISRADECRMRYPAQDGYLTLVVNDTETCLEDARQAALRQQAAVA